MGLTTIVVVGGYLVFWTLTLSLLARRFLELRAGPLRLLVSGAAGVTVAGLTAGGQVQASDRSLGFVLLFIGIGLLVAMGGRPARVARARHSGPTAGPDRFGRSRLPTMAAAYQAVLADHPHRNATRPWRVPVRPPRSLPAATSRAGQAAAAGAGRGGRGIREAGPDPVHEA